MTDTQLNPHDLRALVLVHQGLITRTTGPRPIINCKGNCHVRPTALAKLSTMGMIRWTRNPSGEMNCIAVTTESGKRQLESQKEGAPA